jgi:chaperonin cofactor prefoldin
MLKLNSISEPSFVDRAQIPVVTLKLLTTKEYNTTRDSGFFTKEDLKAIKFYVKKGMSLPTKIDEVKSFIQYQSSGIAGLEPTDIQVLFQAIVDHTLSWDKVERKTLQQAIDLQNYATNIVTAGNNIINIIDKMDISIRAKATLGTLTDKQLADITYSNDDEAVGQALGELLERMKADIAKERLATAKVTTDIRNFRVYIVGGELSNTTKVIGLEPQIRTKKKLMDDNKLSATIASDQKEITDKKARIEVLKKDYNIYMGLVFSGAPVAIAFVVTASIFGPKAKAARIEKEQLVDEVTALEAKLTAAQALQKALEALANKFRDIDTRLQDAEGAMNHLEYMWQTLHTYIDESHNHFKTINDALRLTAFMADFKNVINPWNEVGSIAKDLQEIIDQVLKEWKQEN